MKQNPSKKYILHVMGFHAKKFGALEKFILSLATEARGEGLEIVFIFNSKPWSEEFVTRLNDAEIKYYVANALSPSQFWPVFYKLTKKYRPQIIHSHFQPLFPNLYAWILGYKHRWASLHSMFIDVDLKIVSATNELKLSSRVYRVGINLFTTKFLCVSEAVCKQYGLLYPRQIDKMEVLYNGLRDMPYNKQQARDSLGFEEDTLYFASLVYAQKIKGADILIRAFNEFVKKNRGLKVMLCLIGLAPEEKVTKEVHQMITDFNLEDKILDFGIIDRVPEVLPAMDIYIQASRTESLSYALMEAGLFEIPAIGSNVGGIPEVLLDGKTGFLFPVGDYNALADKMQVLADDKDLRAKLGKASRKHKLANFDLQKNIEQLLAKYKEAMSL